MSHNGNEEELVAEATGILEQIDGLVDTAVLAAGVFSLANLVVAQTAGLMTGSAVSSVAGGSAITDAVSSVAASKVATTAAAAAQGASVRLVVAVTDSAIHVLNKEGTGSEPELSRFDRSTVEVTVQKFGLSRILHLLDPDTGAAIELHGSVSPLSAQSKPDKLVFHLLS